MPLTYTPSTEKIAKSYQRTTRMVPNMGVSALTVVNPGRPVYDEASSLLTPLTGMQLARAGSKGRTSRRTSSRKRRGSKGRTSRRISSRKRRGSMRTLSRRSSSRRRSHN